MDRVKQIFSELDPEQYNSIPSSDLPKVFEAVGRDPEEAENLLEKIDPEREGRITFPDCCAILDRPPVEEDLIIGADPKVVKFLEVLEAYRVKCETEGNYLEAAKAETQIKTLKKQEETRQQKSINAYNLCERQNVQLSHNFQFAEFNYNWDKYMREFDNMAQMYIQRMNDRHSRELKELQAELKEMVANRPPKFTKELLDWRKRENVLAKAKEYSEAQRVKKIADEMEKEERIKMEESNLELIRKKENGLRRQQEIEMKGLLKRIDGRRKEHIKQRQIDSNKLLLRNKNVIISLENKQNQFEKSELARTNESLQPPRFNRSRLEKVSQDNRRSTVTS